MLESDLVPTERTILFLNDDHFKNSHLLSVFTILTSIGKRIIWKKRNEHEYDRKILNIDELLTFLRGT